MPMIGLATLEKLLSFIAGDGLVEQTLLGPAVVEVVVDDLVAEGISRERPFLQRRDRFAQRRGEALRIRLVGVALERGRQLELGLDPVPPGPEQGRAGGA